MKKLPVTHWMWGEKFSEPDLFTVEDGIAYFTFDSIERLVALTEKYSVMIMETRLWINAKGKRFTQS